MELKLIVVRTPDPEKLVNFYALFGLSFHHHRHGNGPWHYSVQIQQSVFEIYPLTKTQTRADEHLRLGFSVDDFENTVELLRTRKTRFITEPVETGWGTMAVIEDPDGRKIELYKSE